MSVAQETVDRLRERGPNEGSKLAHFVMGVAGSGIAFAFHETSGRDFAWSLYLIGGACIFWGLSFSAGVLFHENNIIMHNMDYKFAFAIYQHKEIPVEDLSEYDQRSNKGSRLFYIQMWTILIGALLYAGGHVLFLAEQSAAKIAPAAEVQTGDSGKREARADLDQLREQMLLRTATQKELLNQAGLDTPEAQSTTPPSAK